MRPVVFADKAKAAFAASPPSAGSPAFGAPPPLSLYIHLPWCARKCPYCDFHSLRAPAAIPEGDYARAVLCDAEASLAKVWGRRIISVYFGGGTPSLFAPETIDDMLARLRALFPIAADAEITLEANPDSADAAKFAAYRAAGVNRLSVGAQSFDDGKLAALGRLHDGAQARRAAEAALGAFANVNLDVMFALPNQTRAQMRSDAAVALSLAPPHLSFYQLTIEPDTPFAKAPPPRPSHDAQAAMQEEIVEILAAAGYRRYEVSAYAKSADGGDARCRHNLNYWRFGDYLGLGAGAHGKLTINGEIIREVRHRRPEQYIARAPAGGAVAESRRVSADDAVFEFMLNALRLSDGFRPEWLNARAGADFAAVLPVLREAEERGLIKQTADNIRPTRRGLLFLNDLLQIFLPDLPLTSPPQSSLTSPAKLP